MKTRAAVLFGPGEPWKIEELELDPPQAGEVLVKVAASGLCHTDYHLVTGDIPIGYPIVAGHEGAGIVQEVGPGVHAVQPGDHVVFSLIPFCGRCRWCSTGHQNLCELGSGALNGTQRDGTYRLHTSDGEDVAQFCFISTFSEYTVVPEVSVVPIGEDVPLDRAALLGCGVLTGWGAAVSAAGVQPGEVVVVYGVGGVGINAVQGARHAGAVAVVAVDPLDNKLELAMELGATHTAHNHDEAFELVADLTGGVLADSAIICAGVADRKMIGRAAEIIGKGGTVVIASVGRPDDDGIDVPAFDLMFYEKTIKGTLYGSVNPSEAIPKLVTMYRAGDLELDRLASRTYTLDQINEGYDDMLAGRNLRGVVRFD
jgi:alcohol dehydrogenase (nicotinoprotein)